jgi:hypothetical protein
MNGGWIRLYNKIKEPPPHCTMPSMARLPIQKATLPLSDPRLQPVFIFLPIWYVAQVVTLRQLSISNFQPKFFSGCVDGYAC